LILGFNIYKTYAFEREAPLSRVTLGFCKSNHLKDTGRRIPKDSHLPRLDSAQYHP